MPRPCWAETACTWPKPKLAQVLGRRLGRPRRRTCWRRASSGDPIRRSRSATSRSPAVGAVWTSTTNRIRSASSMPAHRLGGDLLADRARVGVVDAAGVDELEGAPVPLGAGLAPVAGHARHGVDHGVAPSGEPVEERGLADVGVADDRHDGWSVASVLAAAWRGFQRARSARFSAIDMPRGLGARPARLRGSGRRSPPSYGRRPRGSAGCAIPAADVERSTGGPNATATRRKRRWLPHSAAGTTVTPARGRATPRRACPGAGGRRCGGSPRGTSAGRRPAPRTSGPGAGRAGRRRRAPPGRRPGGRRPGAGPASGRARPWPCSGSCAAAPRRPGSAGRPGRCGCSRGAPGPSAGMCSRPITRRRRPQRTGGTSRMCPATHQPRAMIGARWSRSITAGAPHAARGCPRPGCTTRSATSSTSMADESITTAPSRDPQRARRAGAVDVVAAAHVLEPRARRSMSMPRAAGRRGGGGPAPRATR